MFMPDKPHRYGTKMFMTCDAVSAYCHRFEIYVGKRQNHESTSQAFDHKTGAAAVIRNLKAVLDENDSGFRIIIVDRFYTSVALAIQLLSMPIYMIGTIMTSRLGFDKNIVERRKTRPATVERGSFKFSRSLAVPTMVACHWWDRKPVHYLATGVSMTEDSIKRKLKAVRQATFGCPKLVTDYQRWMGGVDVHDQLRLQTFSVQTSFRFRKYYKGLFLGLFDLALVNAYLTHKEACRLDGVAPMKRVDWYKMLHKQLTQLTDEDFKTSAPTPSPIALKRRRNTSHVHKQLDDWVVVSGVQKRRQRSCKVCSLYRGEQKKSYQTTYYCEDCSQGDAKCFLCPKARRGTDTTCFQVWHDDFECGASIPSHLGKRVVLRRARKAAGVRKKTRREILSEEKEEILSLICLDSRGLNILSASSGGISSAKGENVTILKGSLNADYQISKTENQELYEPLKPAKQALAMKDQHKASSEQGLLLYHGLGSGFLAWGKRFVRQFQFARRVSGFPWTEDVKVDVLGHHLTGMAERYCYQQRLTHAFATKITAAQSMKMFTAPRSAKRSWIEHYLYLVAVSESCGDADNLVLDNIVYNADPAMRVSMFSRLNLARTNYLRQAEQLAHFAQSTEIEMRGKQFGERRP
ncbi:hypothetical protein F443_19412 [Phytophthora nicotianae P1569]|uniref:PiggyBac transposable element-derived protein domain-containing protein n=1 Tax=Phytophthora nicotianae P1569 TaxID=1317065 RepID=V9E4V1_PHYNI|nr:hypothetical protein F443_19412 [Phytophthora nicotianae P1569]